MYSNIFEKFFCSLNFNMARTFAIDAYASVTAAAAPKSLQSCPTLCDPVDSSPPGSPIPGILQARTVCYFLCNSFLEYQFL